MMVDVPTDLGPAEEPAEWDGVDADDFGRARHLLTELVTVLAALSRSRGGQEAERQRAEELRAEELRYAEERQRLSVVDRAEVARILAVYPARLDDLKRSRP